MKTSVTASKTASVANGSGDNRPEPFSRMYSFAAGAVAAVKPQPPPASASKYREAWSAQALACLKQAVAAGWKDAARLEQEKDLEALRAQPEFQKLLQALKQPAK